MILLRLRYDFFHDKFFEESDVNTVSKNIYDSYHGSHKTVVFIYARKYVSFVINFTHYLINWF